MRVITINDFSRNSFSKSEEKPIDETITYSSLGVPLNKKQFIDQINNGIIECEQGLSSSHEEFMKELEVD